MPHIVPIGSAVGEVASLAGSGMRKNMIVSGTNPSLGVLCLVSSCRASSTRAPPCLPPVLCAHVRAALLRLRRAPVVVVVIVVILVVVVVKVVAVVVV